MTEQEWKSVALLLHRGFKWRDPFGGAHERAYRTLLDGYTPEQLATAIRTLVARGQVFGPSPGEITAALERDPTRPVFTEAFHMLYGRRGVLSAREPRDGEYWDESETLTARDAAAIERAWELHSLLGSFVEHYGIARLRALEVDHEDHGQLVRRELEQEWEVYAEANAHRDAVALASGRRRQLTRGGPARFDPATLLGIGQSTTTTQTQEDAGR